MLMRRVFECPGGFTAIGDELLVEMWRAPATIEQLRELARVFRVEMQRRSNKPFGVLAVMGMSPSTVLTVSEQERALILERAQQMSQRSFGGVTVLTMSGFSGALVRGVLSTLTHLRGQRAPMKVVGTLDEGIVALQEFFVQHGPGARSEATLRQAIEDSKPADWK